MNPRQRRGALLLVATAIGAVVVFLAMTVYVADINAKVGPMAEVLRLTVDVDAYQAIEPGMLETVEVPQRWAPPTALHALAQTSGLVAATALREGTVLGDGLLIEPPTVQPGYREIAIVVDAETGVAGKVKPGDHVDIIATIDATDTAPARAEVWASDVLVLEVGVAKDTAQTDNLGNFSSGRGIPVTFALTTSDALRLAYVESFSVKLRLALRGDGDDAVLPGNELVFTSKDA